MLKLFDYQINCFSDNDNHTDLPFSVFSMTQQGMLHSAINLGNQDAACVYVGKKIIIGALCDGCTSGNNLSGKSSNQVGAHIGSYLAVRNSRKLLLKNRMPLSQITPSLEYTLISQYKKILNTLKPWKMERQAVIRNFLLTTLIIFIITDTSYWVAHCGDGSIIINSEDRSINADSGNYLASNLKRFEDKRKGGDNILSPKLSLKVVEQGSLASLSNLFIATDGFLDHDIRRHPVFEKFFLSGNTIAYKKGIIDRRKELRSEFLHEIAVMKDGRIWPRDDATFISIQRISQQPKRESL